MRSDLLSWDEAEVGAPRTLIEGACRRLMRDIVECRYAPGDKLRIAHLKKVYQVSGSTLREALSLLVSQSLVVAEEQRGFRVAPMSLADLEDLTRMRVMLECAALEESLSTGNDDWEAKVVSCYHTLTLAEGRMPSESHFNEWERRNADFHEALLSGCTSPWLHRFRRTLYQQLERYRRLTALKGMPTRRVHDEHAKIFEAVMKRDVAAATAALGAHIQATCDLIRSRRLLEPNSSRDAATP